MIGCNSTSVEYDSFGQDYRLSRFMRYDFRGNVVWECERYDNMAEQTVLDTRQVALRHTLDNSGRVVRTDYYPTGLPVDITLRSSATYHLAHELKHAYQFETGQLSIANISQPYYYMIGRMKRRLISAEHYMADLPGETTKRISENFTMDLEALMLVSILSINY